MKGFKITFHLASEIIPYPFATLDSVLGHTAFIKSNDFNVADNLPFEKIPFKSEEGDGWFYAASSWVAGDVIKICISYLDNKPILRRYFKLNPIQNWLREYYGKTQINERSGSNRGYLLEYQSVATNSVSFTGKGDIDSIKYLADLAVETGIFKKTAIGHGWVKGYDIVTHEWSLWDNEYPVRPIPLAGKPKTGQRIRRQSVNSPYWCSKEFLCVMPKPQIMG